MIIRWGFWIFTSVILFNPKVHVKIGGASYTLLQGISFVHIFPYLFACDRNAYWDFFPPRSDTSAFSIPLRKLLESMKFCWILNPNFSLSKRFSGIFTG